MNAIQNGIFRSSSTYSGFFSQVPRSDSLFVSIVSVYICVAMMCHPSVVVKLFLVHPLFVSVYCCLSHIIIVSFYPYHYCCFRVFKLGK